MYSREDLRLTFADFLRGGGEPLNLTTFNFQKFSFFNLLEASDDIRLGIKDSKTAKQVCKSKPDGHDLRSRNRIIQMHDFHILWVDSFKIGGDNIFNCGNKTVILNPNFAMLF